MNRPEIDTNEMKLLLPWYVNGTLAASERAAVRQHLETCRECREAEAELRRISSAVEQGQPTPLVPEPKVAEFLEKTFVKEERTSSPKRGPWLAAAASVLVIIAGTYWFVASLPEPNVFRTVTDPGGSSEISYVFDLETSTPADDSVRAAVSEAFAGGHLVETESGYRLTVSMPSATMKELNEYAKLLQQVDGVQRVEIAGVQLPLE